MSMAAAVLVLLPSIPVAAQEGGMVGQRVRVELTDARRLEGLVVHWTSEALTLDVSDGSQQRLEWAEVYEVERYRTRRRTLRGLGIGMGLGAVAAGAHAGITWETCSAFCFGPSTRAGTVALAGLIGAVAGGVVGTLFGAMSTQSSWELVVVPPVLERMERSSRSTRHAHGRGEVSRHWRVGAVLRLAF